MRKAQHKGKRVLASALCVGMLASMVPTQAFAADEQPVAAVVRRLRLPPRRLRRRTQSPQRPQRRSLLPRRPRPLLRTPRTEETPVEEAPAEEAALAPMDAPVEEALAAEETAAPLRRRLLHLRPPRLASQQTSVWSLPESIGRIM